MATSNAEDYLKAIYCVCDAQAVDAAPTGELARRLGLTPGSVTGMLQRLDRAGLVEYAPHQGARLTDQGRQAALRIIRRHRLLELFLVESLGMPWDEVHDEAESLEHSASDRLIDHIDEYLGRPNLDPHGDPIPDSDGNVLRVAGDPLAACIPGMKFEVKQVDDSSEQLLRYLRENGLDLATCGTVVRNDAGAGIVEIEVQSKRFAISHEAAGRILVNRAEADTPEASTSETKRSRP